MCWSTHYEFNSQLELNGSLVPIKDRVLVKHHKTTLEDIPEETELRSDTNVESHDDDDVDEFDGTTELEEAQVHLETDLEVLRRAMDMGIWALCLGFGYMLSRTSIPHLRKPPRIFGFYYHLS